MQTKDFDISDVLSVTTGSLVAERGMEGIYDIMGWMTQDPGITTLGLLAQSQPCKDALLSQHPELVGVEVPDWDSFVPVEASREQELEIKKREIDYWLTEQAEIYGRMLSVEQINVAFKDDLEIFYDVRVNGVDYTK